MQLFTYDEKNHPFGAYKQCKYKFRKYEYELSPYYCHGKIVLEIL